MCIKFRNKRVKRESKVIIQPKATQPWKEVEAEQQIGWIIILTKLQSHQIK